MAKLGTLFAYDVQLQLTKFQKPMMEFDDEKMCTYFADVVVSGIFAGQMQSSRVVLLHIATTHVHIMTFPMNFTDFLRTEDQNNMRSKQDKPF
mmetsp:Transcript_1804/g.3773  ORF Transcript_1804/g.3773 Transcript_1804/m.3773 type:complete len:93 (-) Transcript_1804:2023-2301(-)